MQGPWRYGELLWVGAALLVLGFLSDIFGGPQALTVFCLVLAEVAIYVVFRANPYKGRVR